MDAELDEYLDFQSPVLDQRQVGDIQDWLLEIYSGKEEKERSILVAAMINYWAKFELKILRYGKKLSTRQAFLVAQELVISETRETYADLNVRRKFTLEGESIEETRDNYESMIVPDDILEARLVDDTREKIERSAARLRSGVEHELVEVE